MKCEEVRPQLPELAEGGPRSAGPLQEHLVGCEACSTDLAELRSVVLELGNIRELVVDPPEDFLGKLLEEMPEHAELRPGVVRRVAQREGVQYAAFSLGGAVIGATAIGLLWWRAAKRSPAEVAQASN